MSATQGVQLVLAKGVFSGAAVHVSVVNPRGKPSFSRKLTVNNPGTGAIVVVFPGQAAPISGTGSVADAGITIAAGGSKDFEGAIVGCVITGTSGQPYEVSATVAG